jgi:hypothetical protein
MEENYTGGMLILPGITSWMRNPSEDAHSAGNHRIMDERGIHRWNGIPLEVTCSWMLIYRPASFKCAKNPSNGNNARNE